MKAMISQPMAQKSDEEIEATRNKAIKELEALGYTVVNTWRKEEWHQALRMQQRGVVNVPLCFLAQSLEKMSECEAIYFCKGWEKARGCFIENEAAKAYDLKIFYEE